MAEDSGFIRRFPTVDDYMRHHQQAGHTCCYCPQQDLPCCNAGHEEAERLRREFEEMVAALRGDQPDANDLGRGVGP